MARQTLVSTMVEMLLRLAPVGVLGFLVSAGCPPSTPPPPAPANQNVACFKQFTGVPYNSTPPTIDGQIAGDVGWTNAFRYVVNNGASVPDMAMMGIRNDIDNSLYFSFLVNNDVSFDDEDAIVLTFRSSAGVAADDRRIIIYPLFASVGAGTPVSPNMGAAPHSVSYWVGSNTWNTGTPTATPAWLALPASTNVRVGSYSTSATTNSWWVEMKIPTDASGLNLPAGTNFKLSWDVIRWNGLASTAVEFPWPATAGLTGGAVMPIENSTAIVANWGDGNRTDANICNGVSFDWYDIAVVHPAGSMLSGNEIAWNQPNDFTVTPHNDAVNAGGTYVPAPQVFGVFQLANWGINGAGTASPNNWVPIVIPANPPTVPTPITETPPADIPAAVGATQGSVTLTLPGWSVPGNLVSQYQATPHQCVRVELDAKAPGVTFKNASTWNNMDFRQAMSPFTDTASVMTRGYAIGRDRDSVDVLLSAFTYNVPPAMKWETRISGAREVGLGQYLLRGSTRQDARISTSVLPPSISIPSVDLRLPPGAAAAAGALRIPARPGTLVTLLSSGSVRVRRDTSQFRGTLAGPDGVDLGEGAAGAQYVLPREQRPWKHAGALVGSWDGFQKSAFLVGSARSFRAPNRAEVLTLALNDTPDGLKQHTGEGFAIQVIQTPVEPYLTPHNPVIGQDFEYERTVIPTGANLPTWILCGSVKTGRRVRAQTGKVADLVTSAGCYGSMVNRIRQ